MAVIANAPASHFLELRFAKSWRLERAALRIANRAVQEVAQADSFCARLARPGNISSAAWTCSSEIGSTEVG